MIGHPKFAYNDIVDFKFNDTIKTGQIEIIDAYGTVEQNTEPSYDIFVEAENTLYKHIVESLVSKHIPNTNI